MNDIIQSNRLWTIHPHWAQAIGKIKRRLMTAIRKVNSHDQIITYGEFFAQDSIAWGYPSAISNARFIQLPLHSSDLIFSGSGLVFRGGREIFVDLNERVITRAIGSYFGQLLADGIKLPIGIGSQEPCKNSNSDSGGCEKNAVMLINPVYSFETYRYKLFDIFFNLFVVAIGYLMLAWGLGMTGLQRSLRKIGYGAGAVIVGIIAISHGFWNSVH